MDAQSLSLFPLLVSAALFFIGYGMGTKAALKSRYRICDNSRYQGASDEMETLTEELEAANRQVRELENKIHDQELEIEGLTAAVDRAEANIWMLRNQIEETGSKPTI